MGQELGAGHPRRQSKEGLALDERSKARAHLDALPDPDSPDHGGGLRPTGPAETEKYRPVAEDQLPDPDDPTGVSLQLSD
jgi:hypothetical protein